MWLAKVWRHHLPQISIFMKALLNFCSSVSLVWLISLAVGNNETARPSAPVRKSGVPATAAHTIPAFTPHARAKVVQYFDTYRTEPTWLPSTSVADDETPSAWTHSALNRGAIIAGSERAHLVNVPAELLRVFPGHLREIDYYLAGSNLVAVDKSYRIVDAIYIPSTQYQATRQPIQYAQQLQVGPAN